VPEEIMKRGGALFQPADVLLVVEVLAPSNAAKDLVLKRHDYATAGIPQYWIADPHDDTLTVLVSEGGEPYQEAAVLRPGEVWTTDRPFPIRLDPAEFF
jgi:Uma2 family endonuclease